jgi:hypothetical protein
LVLPVAIPENDVDQNRFRENENDSAKKEQAVPEEIDLAPEIGMRDECGVGMRFVAGEGRDGDRPDQCV